MITDATVRLLLKSPSADLVFSQYRPVSNLSFLSKITEKGGIGQLSEYLSLFDLHSSHQSAYKENFSTETALCCLFNQLLWSMEQGKVIIMVALDLSSAFDTVDHSTLGAVLDQDFGIRGTSLQWVRSYLKDRKMVVSVENGLSSARTFNFSVPQGSCLGPLLFYLYSSTIKECVLPDQRLCGYADNHFVLDSFNPTVPGDEVKCIDCLENSIVNVSNWMQSNTLKMNANKTEVSLIGRKQMLAKVHSEHMNVSGESVKISQGLKYLGIRLDNNLTMKHHIDLNVKAAAGNIRRISHIRDFIDTNTAKVLAPLCCLIRIMRTVSFVVFQSQPLPNFSICKIGPQK